MASQTADSAEPAASPPAHGAKRSRHHNGSASRREELVQIAGRLFAEKGYLATTIRDIADAAGILSGSLYHHFASKESIADELMRGYWTELLDQYEAVISADSGTTEMVKGLIYQSVLLLEHRELAVRLSTNDWNYLASIFPYMDEKLARTQQIWVDVIQRGIEAHEFAAGTDPVIAYRTVMSSISGTARWFRPGGGLTIEELAKQMSDILLNGLMARPNEG